MMMMNARQKRAGFILMATVAAACHAPPQSSPSPAVSPGGNAMVTSMLDAARQIVVVKTADWSTTKGTLQRYERDGDRGSWMPIGGSIPIVVGRTGLAWGIGFDALSRNEQQKHEGDGKSPAGVFPLDTAFGFAPSMAQLKVPYFPLRDVSDCVDDVESAHYNTVVDRDRVPAVDWNSAEHMRRIGQYKVGIIVGYNAATPVKARGSCVFLHIWGEAGADSYTAGCTAMDENALRDVMLWLDAQKKPMLVQLTSDAYARLRGDWRLP
jgi:D-alanyl-D-alanine dipeptidase